MRKSTKFSATKSRRKRTSRRRVSRRRVSRRRVSRHRVSRRRVSRKLKFKMAPYDDDSSWDEWRRPRLGDLPLSKFVPPSMIVQPRSSESRSSESRSWLDGPPHTHEFNLGKIFNRRRRPPSPPRPRRPPRSRSRSRSQSQSRSQSPRRSRRQSRRQSRSRSRSRQSPPLRPQPRPQPRLTKSVRCDECARVRQKCVKVRGQEYCERCLFQGDEGNCSHSWVTKK